MSTEAGRHTLAEYVEALIEALRKDDPGGLSRMRELVGARAARIGWKTPSLRRSGKHRANVVGY
jgi:hypothetical protein